MISKKSLAVALFLLVLTVFVSGCSTQTNVKSTEDAVNKTGDIAEGVDDIASKLDKATKILSGE